MIRHVYAAPKFVKNTQLERVLPANAASTESPSRNRVVDKSFTSFCRFTQPSRDTMTTLSSSTMKSSAEYSGSSLSLAISVRRLSALPSPYWRWTSSSSARTSFQRLSSSLSSAPICRARLRFYSSSLRMIRISSRASR